MTIGITGEGPDDYGKMNYDGNLVKGAAEGFAEKIADEDEIKIEWIFIDRRNVERTKLGSRTLRGLKGKAINAARFRKQASIMACDTLIYYCDADRDAGTKNSSRHQAEERYDEIYHEVSQGLGDKYPQTAIPMIPLRIIENWLLGDRDNLSSIFEVNSKKLPENTELLWGDKRNPKSSYPKRVLERIRATGNPRKCDTTDYEIAYLADVESMKKSCPYSYGKHFYEDFKYLCDQNAKRD